MIDNRQAILIKNMQTVKAESDATQKIYDAMQEFCDDILTQLLGSPSNFKVLLDEITLIEIKNKEFKNKNISLPLELLENQLQLKTSLIDLLVYQNIKNIENKIKNV